MKIYHCFLVLLYGMMAQFPGQSSCKRSIEEKGMRVSWEFYQDSVEFEVFAPTTGWVAIGLNEEDALIGNNLIMGKLEEGVPVISDRYIIGFGVHHSVEDLCGERHISQVNAFENETGTTIQFRIRTSPKDDFHQALKKGKCMYLLMAYSNSDDFEHHSVMRTSVKVRL